MSHTEAGEDEGALADDWRARIVEVGRAHMGRRASWLQMGRQLMATIADLTAAVDALKTALASEEQAVAALVAEVAALKGGQGLSAEEQAALDAAVADVQGVSASLAKDQADESAA